jgi:hypothetical protein
MQDVTPLLVSIITNYLITFKAVLGSVKPRMKNPKIICAKQQILNIVN